ncbi:hypothetical protein [Bordetella bronchiseptica]|uniref:hypothetical protein n=1 Tax=Bordetella bronchiseptica TaxID=518 RepID=UPI000528CD33|nr:hypothetical protein [Bordetella bronchiseptica]
MSFFELTTAGAMLEKARRELARLQNEASVDHVYNFFVTAYHVTDYLKPVLSDTDYEELRADPQILFCADACNKAKHMKITRGRPDPRTYAESGAIGGSAINAVAINASGERWVQWDDGTRLEVVQFAQALIAWFDKFFAAHGIPAQA